MPMRAKSSKQRCPALSKISFIKFSYDVFDVCKYSTEIIDFVMFYTSTEL